MQQQPIDLLIHAKWMMTCENHCPVFIDHAVAIHNGYIQSILPSKQATECFLPAEQYHCPTHAILPGFVNSHTHIGMNLFRGIADDLELIDWLNNHIWPIEKKWVSPSLVHDAALLGIAEMLRCGTTCFNESYFFMDAIAQAVETTGIRAAIGMLIINVPTSFARNTAEYFEKAMQFYTQYAKHPRIIPTLAPHSTYMLSTDDLLQIKTLAKHYSLKIHIHLQESANEIEQSLLKHQQRPLQHLHQLGMLSPNLIAVHMTQINDQDLEILNLTQPTIVHCPESNMKLASGICPVSKLMQAGINVAIGTDSVASNNDLDMLGEIRTAALLGKIATYNPKTLSAETVLKMATINGARALGLDHIIGSLAPGKAADLIAINLNEIETQPVYSPISQIVYAAVRQQITDTWIAGKHLLKNRKLQMLDEAELLNKASQWHHKIKTVSCS